MIQGRWQKMTELRKFERHDRKAIKKLYISAFPSDERAPFGLLMRKVRRGLADMQVAESDGEFAGFIYLVTLRDMMYFFYFAVESDKRGHGIGSSILRKFIASNSDKRIFLAREQLDSSADNYDERVRRHDFYLHNGFHDVPYCIKEGPVTYDVMCTGESVSPEEYDELISQWCGRFRMRFIEMRLFENNGGSHE